MIFNLPHNASSYGYKIYKDMINTPDPNVNYDSVILEYKQSLINSGYEDIASHQIHYALKIASGGYVAVYEDLFKLVSLCYEIFALVNMGLEYNETEMQDFQEDVSKCRKSHKGIFNEIIQSFDQDWNIDIWSKFPLNNILS